MGKKISTIKNSTLVMFTNYKIHSIFTILHRENDLIVNSQHLKTNNFTQKIQCNYNNFKQKIRYYTEKNALCLQNSVPISKQVHRKSNNANLITQRNKKQ